MWDRRAQVTSVHDGDSCTVLLDQGFGDTKTFSGRLLGVYAPELSQPGGVETRAFVQQWVSDRNTAEWPFVVTTARTRTDREVTTLGRYVITLTTLDGTQNLNLAVAAFVAASGYGGGIGG